VLCDFVNKVIDIQDLAVVHSTTPDEAQALTDRTGATFDKERIRLARPGPALGVPAGPGALAVAKGTK
jgi:fatty acid-binding protein DegV